MPRLVNILLIALMVCVIFSVSLTPLRSTNDTWWHLKTGKMLLERGLDLPEFDIFAYTSENIPWHNHEWLAQVIFFLFYGLGDGTVQNGIQLVILLKALVIVLTYLFIFFLAFQETRSIPIAVLVSVWSLLLARRTLYQRPPIFTYLFFSGYLFLLRECYTGRLKRTWLWILPLAMILWVNLHGGFLVGVIAVGAYVVADIVKGKTLRDKRIWKNGALLLSCILASLLNPSTYHVWLLPGRVMQDIGLVRIIPELHSPDFFYTISFEVLILFLVLAFALAKKKVLTLAEGLVLIFFMHQAIQHIRHLPLVGIVAAPICARLLHVLKNDYCPEKIRRFVPLFAGGIFVLLSGYIVFNHRESGGSFFERNLNYSRGLGYHETNYPVPEADFIIANDFKGRMYNQINIAGYLIWRLSPEYHKVFTDSRYDIFGGKFMRHEQIIQGGLDKKVYPDDFTWDELLDKWDINFILITGGAPVNPLLEESGRWKLVYHRIQPHSRTTRSGYKIYLRNVPENQSLITRCLNSFKIAYPQFELE